MDLELENLAELIMFGNIKTKIELEQKIIGKWEFKKNKTIEDINKAVKLGLNAGNGKTENEISCVAFYLKDVFKKVKRT